MSMAYHEYKSRIRSGAKEWSIFGWSGAERAVLKTAPLLLNLLVNNIQTTT